MEIYESPLERRLINFLKQSRKRWGEIYPTIRAKNGKVIDGRHRQCAGWESSITIDVEDEVDIIALRLSLHHRRIMPYQEKRALINTLAEKLIQERGVEIGQVAEAISELTAIPRRTIYYYLDKRFKQIRNFSANLQYPAKLDPPYFQAILYLPKELLPLVETYKKAKGLRDVREALKTLIIDGLKHHGLLS